MSGSRRRARTGNAAHPVVYPKPVIIIIRGEGNSESRPDQLFARSSFFFLALGKTRCRNSRVRCSWIKINDIYLLSFFLFPRITIRGESEIAYHGICRVATCIGVQFLETGYIAHLVESCCIFFFWRKIGFRKEMLEE